MISKKEVEYIAKLAKISLEREEIEELQKELSRILDYIEKLKEVDIENVKEMSHSILVENVTRCDEKIQDFEFERERLIEQFSFREGNFLKVKRIIQE